MRKFILLIPILLSGCGDPAKTQFVDGCKDQYPSEKICECIYDDMTKKLGPAKNWQDFAIHDQVTFFRSIKESAFKCASK